MNDSKWDVGRLDSGARNALKRCAGSMLGDDMKAIEAFWRAAGSVPKGCESAWFACLCMQCLWKPEAVTRIQPYEECLRNWYRDTETSDSLKSRVISLLDIPWGPDGFLLGKLCNFARRMRAADASAMPDFSKLADDLMNWNSSDHWVQRRWIRTICGNRKDDANQTAQEMEDTENAD